MFGSFDDGNGGTEQHKFIADLVSKKFCYFDEYNGKIRLNINGDTGNIIFTDTDDNNTLYETVWASFTTTNILDIKI